MVPGGSLSENLQFSTGGTPTLTGQNEEEEADQRTIPNVKHGRCQTTEADPSNPVDDRICKNITG